MAKKYGRGMYDVEDVIREYNEGRLTIGRNYKKTRSPRFAVTIGHSEVWDRSGRVYAKKPNEREDEENPPPKKYRW
jgi:hypothetical protein